MDFSKGSSQFLNYDDVSENSYLVFPIGFPIGVFTNIAGVIVPKKENFIELTKDLTGVSLFNENKLGSQALVSVSSGVRRYTSVIIDANSPLFGQTISLMNSTEVRNSASVWSSIPSVVGAIENPSGAFMENQFQGHGHSPLYSDYTSYSGVLGDIVVTRDSPVSGFTVLANSRTGEAIELSNGPIRFGNQTRQDTYLVKYFMRIK